MSMTVFRDPFFDYNWDNFFWPDFDLTPANNNNNNKNQGNRQLTAARVMPFPAMDIVKKDNEYVVSCDLPGVDKAEVKVSITHQGSNSVVTISGERKDEHREENKQTGERRYERHYGKFSRSFTLPEDADDKGVKAKQENGVLVLTLPRMKQSNQPKQTVVKID
jgi:HSP20 family protein